VALTWQASLLEQDEPGFDAAFTGAARRFLGDGAWVDVVPGWATGAGALFERVMDAAPWGAHDRWMYDRMVAEPRLTTGEWTAPPQPVPAMSECLTRRYGADLSVVSANLYRDGQDSVAWHGDRVGRTRTETVVAILSLGATRRFLLRPKGGGASVRLTPNSGDLLVLGGTCQRTWEHCVPKCASAGPRVSVMWRENAAM
jgi:alkylated DNA repair dioxygenase AlkB